MTLFKIRIAAAMILRGVPEKVVIRRLGISDQRFQRQHNEVLFEVALQRAGIPNVQHTERVA